MSDGAGSYEWQDAEGNWHARYWRTRASVEVPGQDTKWSWNEDGEITRTDPVPV